MRVQTRACVDAYVCEGGIEEQCTIVASRHATYVEAVVVWNRRDTMVSVPQHGHGHSAAAACTNTNTNRCCGLPTRSQTKGVKCATITVEPPYRVVVSELRPLPRPCSLRCDDGRNGRCWRGVPYHLRFHKVGLHRTQLEAAVVVLAVLQRPTRHTAATYTLTLAPVVGEQCPLTSSTRAFTCTATVAQRK